MELLGSTKDHSYNILHNSGVQTSVKVSPSGEFIDDFDRNNPVLNDKNKYTVIISSSKGCQMSCGFCHLTALNKPFMSITKDDIVNNVIQALTEVSKHEDLSKRYIKLCYMGEGEPILDMQKTSDSAQEIIDIALNSGLACGVDGVDIATCMPKVGEKILNRVIKLNETLQLKNYNLNPYNYSDKNRSIVRLFYSLHHYDQIKRDIIIPNSRDIDTTLSYLDNVCENGVNVVFHYMFMSGVNDSTDDILGLKNFVNSNQIFAKTEFRVLRYNGYDNTESSNLPDIVQDVKTSIKVRKFKVQFSAGEEIDAACGMFLLN